MLYVSNSAPSNQTVMVLRLTSRVEAACSYTELLRQHGLNLIECFTLDSAQNVMKDGCRVGLLIVTREDELRELDKYESFVGGNRISWVGLVAQELISMPRMRQFIGEHLFNFITLPAELDHIVLTLRHAWGMAFMRDIPQAVAHTAIQDNTDYAMVGKTPEMQRLFGQIQKVARTDASVLIMGPSGTGKELAALSIHHHSARSNSPFVAVNCGAIAPQLFQSELFGYEKGAFTGAAKTTPGKLEAANGGTVFLDEIGEMPTSLQAKMLRVLQDRTVERIGGRIPIPLDLRIVCATNRKLDKLIGTGRTFVVVDPVGAGQGEMVLIVQGSSARLTPETEKLPVDCAIIGIVDSVNVLGKTVFSAREDTH